MVAGGKRFERKRKAGQKKEKAWNVLQGRILRDYRIGTDGQVLDTEKYYAIPTKEDLINWCNDRKIDTTKLFI